MTGTEQSRIARRYRDIDRVLAWCETCHDPTLAALDALCRDAVYREGDCELRARIVHGWDALPAAEQARLRKEAAATFAQWQREDQEQAARYAAEARERREEIFRQAEELQAALRLRLTPEERRRRFRLVR